MIETAGAVQVGALDPDHPDAPVAAHYGDPMREQRTSATEVGLVDRSHRGVIAVSGADRLGWLHSLTSQHLADLPAMTGTELLLLNPQGHVEEHAGVVDDGATTWLDVTAERVRPMLDFLARMVFMMRVTPGDAGPDRALLTLVGPATGQALARLGAAALPDADVLPVPPPKFAAGSVAARASARYPAVPLPAFDGIARRTVEGAELLVPRSAVADLARDAVAAGVPLAGIWAYEALRVAARRPRFGFETDHRTLPSEVGWFTAVHLDKGCYRGQESVARVHHLGRPPRRLVLLHLDGVTEEVPPARHAPVIAGGAGGERTVGMVGTGVRHFELGTIALALVRQNVRDDAALRVGAATAMIDPG